MDVFTKEKRSWIMGRIRGRDTSPEKAVRRLLRKQGLKFGLYGKKVPGHPDLVLRKQRVAVFVHGCFWHGHTCKDGRRPESNVGYWNAKLDRNKRRDRRIAQELRALGWKRIVVWQCQLREPEKVVRRLTRLLRTVN